MRYSGRKTKKKGAGLLNKTDELSKIKEQPGDKLEAQLFFATVPVFQTAAYDEKADSYRFRGIDFDYFKSGVDATSPKNFYALVCKKNPKILIHSDGSAASFEKRWNKYNRDRINAKCWNEINQMSPMKRAQMLQNPPLLSPEVEQRLAKFSFAEKLALLFFFALKAPKFLLALPYRAMLFPFTLYFFAASGWKFIETGDENHRISWEQAKEQFEMSGVFPPAFAFSLVITAIFWLFFILGLIF